ncbi:ephrin type-A receptor 7-like isoform X1 [Arapaima gigas]
MRGRIPSAELLTPNLPSVPGSRDTSLCWVWSLGRRGVWPVLGVAHRVFTAPGSEACPPGSYKMSSRQQECFPCPAHSVAEEEGSVLCVCEEDHYRTPLDNPAAPCTRPPTPPRNLVFTLKQSTLVLQWDPPADSGGRGDLSYTVGCSRCAGAALGPCEPCGASVAFLPQQSGLTERSVTVVNLLPHSDYTFTVEALNGVSELLPNKRFYAQVNVSTSPAEGLSQDPPGPCGAEGGELGDAG